MSIWRALGTRHGEAEVLNEQAALHFVHRDLARAKEHHQPALSIACAIGSAREEAVALAGLGRCAIAAGDPAQAQDLLRQALKIFQRIGAAEARSVQANLDGLPPTAEDEQ